MRIERVSQALVVAAIALAFSYLAISAQDTGSCPAGVNCDHTFPGTTIYIGQTAIKVGVAALALFGSSVAVLVYGKLKASRQTD